MTLDKDDIQTAKVMAKVLRQSKSDELVVVGNLLDVLLKEREVAQSKAELSNLERHEQNVRNFLGEPNAEQEPKREWVGLTDDEIKDIFSKQRMIYNTDGVLFGQAVEAKLKEKNCL